MKEFKRDIEDKFKRRLFDAKMISVIYGPRQVGKTTFVKKILRDFGSEDGYYNCERLEVRDVMIGMNPNEMHRAFGNHRIVVLDEAQTVPNIGRALKLLIDEYPEMHIVVTGSSSFDLANEINEPLTGRHWEYFLPPLSINEYVENYSYLEMQANLEELMIYGGYPGIVTATSNDQKQEKLGVLAGSYLYRDVLQFNKVKNPDVLTRILRALALQVGGEVSYAEIAGLVGVDSKTVMSYVRLLEQAFIIFRIAPLVTNERNAIKKRPKFYFYDNGILNALIGNYGGEGVRDMGPLWENLMMTERRKYNQLKNPYLIEQVMHYWRLKSGAEVDLVEVFDGTIHPYEFKFRKNSLKQGAKRFAELYGEMPRLINRENFAEFLLK